MKTYFYLLVIKDLFNCGNMALLCRGDAAWKRLINKINSQSGRRKQCTLEREREKKNPRNTETTVV